jgi:hypothetical protein
MRAFGNTATEALKVTVSTETKARPISNNEHRKWDSPAALPAKEVGKRCAIAKQN